VNQERSITEQIALVERKLELRRERTQRHWREARAKVERGAGWLPLLGVLGALLLGVAAGRKRDAPPAKPAARTGLVATLLALGATAARIAMSPAGRALWAAIRSTRTRPAG
jgi:hypothetical protein